MTSSARWLLPASMSVNVFLAAALAAQALLPGGHRPPPPQHRLEALAEGLPPADAATLREVLAAREAEMGKGRAIMDGIRDGVRDALTAETFDPAALRAVFAEARARRDALDDALVSGLIDAAGRLSPEGRRRLADWAPPGPPRPPGPSGPPPQGRP